MKRLFNRKFVAALKAALWGALLFGAVTLLAFFGDDFLGRTAGAGVSFPGLVVAVPSYFLRQVLGLEFAVTRGVLVFVNTFMGASVFLCARILWELYVRGKDENEV